MIGRRLPLATLVILQSATVHAQTASPPATTTASIIVPLLSALIGAVFAIAGILLKEILIVRANAKHTKAESQKDVVRSYMAPLASSCEKLIWRYKELFIEKRHQWLMTHTLPTSYNEYKRTSTLYRVATLLGWLRAIDLELNNFIDGSPPSGSPLTDAIAHFRKALADGPHTELRRLEQLCDTWKIDISEKSGYEKKAIAIDLEVEYYRVAGSKVKEDPDYLSDLTVAKKLECCTVLATFLCNRFGLKPPSAEFIKERIQSAMESLAYQEALIYREWQDALGDSMLAPDQSSPRKFRIIGYAEFTELLRTRSPWIAAFRTSIEDINLAIVDKRDVRSAQLMNLAVAVADMLSAVAARDANLVTRDALSAGTELQNLRESLDA